MMIVQSTAVGDILLGRDAGWRSTPRRGARHPLRDSRKYACLTRLVWVMAATAYRCRCRCCLVDGSGDFWSVLGRSNAILSSTAGSGVPDPSLAIWHARADFAPLQVLIRAKELANRHTRLAGPMPRAPQHPDLLDAHLRSFRKARNATD